MTISEAFFTYRPYTYHDRRFASDDIVSFTGRASVETGRKYKGYKVFRQGVLLATTYYHPDRQRWYTGLMRDYSKFQFNITGGYLITRTLKELTDRLALDCQQYCNKVNGLPYSRQGTTGRPKPKWPGPRKTITAPVRSLNYAHKVIEGQYTIVKTSYDPYFGASDAWYVTQHGKIYALIYVEPSLPSYQMIMYPFGQSMWTGSFMRIDQAVHAVDDTLARHRMPGAGGRS